MDHASKTGSTKGRDSFNQNFRKFRSKTQWMGSVQLEKFRKNWSTFWGGPLFPVGPVWILVEWIASSGLLRARSIQPKFPEISVQNSMDRFGPTGKVSKKRVHLLRWTTFPDRTSLDFGWMDRAQNPCSGLDCACVEFQVRLPSNTFIERLRS